MHLINRFQLALATAIAPVLAIVGLGLVVTVTKSTNAQMPYTADIQLTATVLAMGGLGYETIDTNLIAGVLAGRYANETTLVGLPWPGELTPFNGTLTLNQSVTIGIANMDAAIRDTPGPKIVAGASGTTLVVDEVMRRLVNDPNAPPADQLSFVVLGDANRGIFKQLPGITLPILDYTVPVIPETKYNVLVLAGQYDGLGDWPDRSWNLLADLNALAGTGILQQVIPQQIVDALKLEAFGSVHYDAMFADLTKVPEANITTTVNAAGGVTTTYLVPTLDLPLLRPLKAMGVPQGAIEILAALLRPIIDSAYMRNDPPSSPRPTRRQAVASAEPTRSAESVRSAASLRSTAGLGDGTVAKPSGRAAKHQASASRS